MPPAASGWRWTVVASIVGFVATFVLSGLLHLPRGLFVAGYALAVGALVALFVSFERVSLRVQFTRRWPAGLVGGLVVGALLVKQVLSQPTSARSEGLALVGDFAWFGVAYGTVDAILLTVLPVLCLYGMRPATELQQPGARLRLALVAILGSALVTAAYHAGFAEFRGPELLQPIIGNTIITIAYLLTGSPLAAVVSHVLMHGAAVAHGMGSTMQLPPHYP